MKIISSHSLSTSAHELWTLLCNLDSWPNKSILSTNTLRLQQVHHHFNQCLHLSLSCLSNLSYLLWSSFVMFFIGLIFQLCLFLTPILLSHFFSFRFAFLSTFFISFSASSSPSKADSVIITVFPFFRLNFFVYWLFGTGNITPG